MSTITLSTYEYLQIAYTVKASKHLLSFIQFHYIRQAIIYASHVPFRQTGMSYSHPPFLI